MKTNLAEQILAYGAMLPEGTPLTAKSLLHLGNRAAADQALSRLTRQDKLMRSGRGMYVRPIESRFGTRAPSPEKVVTETARLRGETVAPHAPIRNCRRSLGVISRCNRKQSLVGTVR